MMFLYKVERSINWEMVIIASNNDSTGSLQKQIESKM